MATTENIRLNIFLHIVLGIISGIMVVEYSASENEWATAMVCAAFIIVAYSLCIQGRKATMRNTLMLFILITTCSAIGAIRYATYKRSLITEWPCGEQTLYAKVDGDIKHFKKTIQTDLLLRDGRKLRAHLVRHENDEPQPGDIIKIRCAIYPPRNTGNPDETDYAYYLLKHGYSGTTFCHANRWQMAGKERPNTKDKLLRFRHKLTSKYKNYFEGRNLAVIAALTLGDRNMLRPEIREVFSHTGTSHILALSGLHLGILFGIYNLLLSYIIKLFRRYRRIAEWIGFLVGLLCVWSFTMLAGIPLSLMRAAIMCSMMQCATIIHRDIFSFNNLSLAAIVILILSPEALFDLGFQLSFLAVLGILLLMPLFPHFKNKGKKRVSRILIKTGIAAWNMLLVSLSAMIFTMPLIAYTFHVVPIYALAASIIAVPITAVLLFFSLMFFFLPFAESLCAAVLQAMSHLLFLCLEEIASLPYASMELYPSLATTFMIYAFIFISYSYIKKDSRWKLIVMILLIISSLVTEKLDYNKNRVERQIVFYNLRTAPALHLIESEEKSWLWTNMPERTDTALAVVKRTFWKKRKINPPRLAKGDVENQSIFITPHTITFRGCRIGLAYERLTPAKAEPLKVNYVYVVKGWNRPLTELLQSFIPDTLIIDSSLSDYYENRVSTEASRLHIPFRSIRKEGCLVLRLRQS